MTEKMGLTSWGLNPIIDYLIDLDTFGEIKFHYKNKTVIIDKQKFIDLLATLEERSQ